jgi:2-dehydro-3-deoxyphosphogluconate aldolase / (4S)-4-hydroxy-2-oxoglutarate aldolase
LAGCYARRPHHVKRVGSCIRVESEEVAVAGWDASARLLGIVRYRGAGDVEGALGALVRGGIRLVEVTLDTPGALDAVERGRRSGWTIGVGTVLEPDQVDRSVDAGAAFVVSPGAVPGVVERAHELGVDVVPGAFTPTEVIMAHAMGVSAVKLFPASMGGPSYLRALLGPLAGATLVPTGGIAIEEVGAYLAAGAACVGLGGALVGERPPANDAELDVIADRAAAAVAAAADRP